MTNEDSTNTIVSPHREPRDESGSDDPEDQDQIRSENWNSSLRWEHARTARGWEEHQPDFKTGDISAGGDITIIVNGKQDSLIEKIIGYVSNLIRNRILEIGTGLTILNLLWGLIQVGMI